MRGANRQRGSPRDKLTLVNFLFILAFGVLGVACRFGANEWATRHLPFPFPMVTLLINVVGSLAIGAVFVAAVEKQALSEPLRLGLMVGFLGGFTTFSAFSLEVLLLLQWKQNAMAAAYALASPVLGVLAAWLGATMTRWALG